MAQVNAYLNFNGNCEAAFTFYKNVFEKEFEYIGRFKDAPSEVELTEEEGNKIMHVTLRISDATVLMGSDCDEKFSPLATFGNNISISIKTDSEEEANDLFNKLSDGGKVTMPLDKTFWGAYFGMFIDKFGINWMVNYDYETNEKQN